MKITRRQLRKLIRESFLVEGPDVPEATSPEAKESAKEIAKDSLKAKPGDVIAYGNAKGKGPKASGAIIAVLAKDNKDALVGKVGGAFDVKYKGVTFKAAGYFAASSDEGKLKKKVGAKGAVFGPPVKVGNLKIQPTLTAEFSQKLKSKGVESVDLHGKSKGPDFTVGVGITIPIGKK